MALFTSYWLYDVLVLAVTALAVSYAYFQHTFQYWRKRGIPTPLKPTFPLGNFPGVSWSKGMDMLAADIYKDTAGLPLTGAYFLNKPIIIVRDMELVKNILVKDFGHFHDRGFEVDLTKEPLAGHLFLMKGQEWRNLRIKLTPTFTSGKMKMMFSTLIDVGNQLGEIFDKASQDEETEIKDILARYTTDVISSVAFGIDTNSLKNPDAEFRKMGTKLAHPSTLQLIQNVLIFAMPKTVKYLPIKLLPQNISDFFINIVRETMDFRRKNSVKRNDFMQLLVQLATLGYVQDADNPEKDLENKENHQKFTIEQAAAQAFLFFFAGFETSSSTMQFALYELALNPELQKRVQMEVDHMKETHGGKITYEGVMGSDLLDRVVSETLRKYPVAAVLLRECSKEYPVPDTDYVLQPGDAVWFPVYGYHHDPQHYPEPEKFDPDRFLPEVKETRSHYSYLPFGEGPRNCIGNRFGLMQTKAGLSLLLSRFTVSPSKKTPVPLVFDPQGNILSVKGGIHLKITKRS